MNDIDKLIAEKIMGWIYTVKGSTDINPRGFRGSIPYYMKDNQFIMYCSQWNPTVITHQVFHVVNALIEKGYSFDLYKTCDMSSVSWGWNASFILSVYPPHSERDFYARHKSLSMSICLAVVHMLESEIDK